MRWCPVVLRTDLDHDCAVSGVYLVDESSRTELAITVSKKLGTQVKANGNRAICALEVSLNRAVWESVEMQSATPVGDLNADLAKYAREFKIIPSEDFQLLVFKFIDPDFNTERARCAKKPFTTLVPQAPMQVEINSSPFAASHISLFHGYVTMGTLNLVNPNFLCIDGRYLDGMEGACVTADGNISVGLVLGSLIKSNGEGRLLIAVPWTLLLRYLAPYLPSTGLPSASLPNALQNAAGLAVVAVRIRVKPNIISWGSGVLVEHGLVATNKHVIGDFPHEKIEILIGDAASRVLSVTYPLKGADLALVRLASPIPARYEVARLAPEDPVERTFVRSVGYGLFAPHRYSDTLWPIQSDGIISKAVPGMLISTAGCWNGSSGGGIFNAKGELVGIMASNARDNAANEIMPDLSMSIPASTLRQALKNAASDLKQQDASETSQQLEKLWKLVPVHQNVRRPLRSKL